MLTWLRQPERRRWLYWGLLAGIFLLVNIYRLSTAVLFEQLMVAFQTTGAQLGTIHAMFFWIYALFQIPAGIMADRLGPRRTAALGGLVMNLGAIGFALSDSYTAALFTRFLVGLGGSVVFISILRFCATWFRPDEFGTMNGLSFGISGIGGILATTPLAVVVATLGWRTTVAGLGVAGLGLAIVAFGVVRDTPPADATAFAVTPGSSHRPSAAALLGQLGDVLGDRWVWVIGVMLFCTSGVNLTLFGLWGIPYVVQTHGTTVTYASLFTLLGSVGIFIGPPAIGWLSDRTGERTRLIVAGAVLYTTVLAIPAVVGTLPLGAIAAVYFVVGSLLGAFVLSYPIVKERHAASASGLSLGTINGAAFLGASVLPTVMGFVLDAYWTGDLVAGVRVYTVTGYRVAFGVATGCGLVACVCAVWLYRHGGPGTGGPEAVK